MKKNEPISNIMTKNPVSVHQGQKVSDIRKLITEHKFHHVPVVSGERLTGMVSASDMLGIQVDGIGADDRSMDEYLDHTFSIEKIMSPSPRCLRATDTVRQAADALSEGSFHALPVVDDEMRLQGIVTSTDLIRYLRDQY